MTWRRVSGLRIDLDAVRGEVKLVSWFENLDSMTRADVLRDWLYDIEQLYFKAVADTNRDAESAAHRR